jgi:hypothetical protein
VTAAVTLIDAIHVNVTGIPPDAAKVAGYVSGTADIQWTTEDWARFPRAGRVRIEQGFGPFDPLTCDVLDVEAGAITPARAVDGVRQRIAHHITWTTIYATSGSLAAVVAALDAAGPRGWYAGHADCWLADWDLDESSAERLLGTEIRGLTCRAVQWASPQSNPGTLVPGSGMPLSGASVDLSVSEAGWHAAADPVSKPSKADALAAAKTVTAYLDG